MSLTGMRALLAGMFLPTLAAMSGTATSAPGEFATPSVEQMTELCAMLDDPRKRGLMDALELRLLVLCGRTHELGRVRSEDGATRAGVQGTDALVNSPAGEAGPTQTQSETSIAINENTGTLCSGYNDSYSGVILGQGYTGFSRSTDGGFSFTDRGALSSSSFGDPSIVWRRLDGFFYFAALHSSGGLGIWRSTDDCNSFQFVGLGHSGFSDDKELLAVDNTPTSPFYGRLHMVWTDFGAGGRISHTRSDNGTTWTTAVRLSTPGDTQGAWPVVAPDGTLYVGWVRWNPYYSGPIDIEIARSTNGGVNFTIVAEPMTGEANPYDQIPTAVCGRPALRGNIRYLPSPQLAVTPNGDLHVVYVYDPDGRNVGDIVDVFYRRSTDQGASWGPEVQLNDDGTLRDQFFPTISAGPTGRLVTSWYDRRLDAGNTQFDYFTRVSNDGGAAWNPSERVSDASSPVYLDPSLATCYHGDYDQQLQTATLSVLQWADDRAVRSGHPDPDVYVDLLPLQLDPDSDGDGFADSQDNCTQLANASQHDTDGDGIGNVCDGDFNNDCAQNFSDLGTMKANFFVAGDLPTDMNEDLITNFADLGALKAVFFNAPGPSGIPNVCDAR